MSTAHEIMERLNAARRRYGEIAQRLGPPFTRALEMARLRIVARRALSWWCPDDCRDL